MMKPTKLHLLSYMAQEYPKSGDSQAEPRTPPTSTTNDTDLTTPGDDHISDNDVLCGRGGRTNSHPGNLRFRLIVADHQSEYLAARKPEKIVIAKRIVNMVKDKGGRFLRKYGEVWTPISDKKAQEKTSQALREGLDVRNKTVRPNKQIRRHTVPTSPDGAGARTVPGKVALVAPPVMPLLQEELPNRNIPPLLPLQRQISQSEIAFSFAI